MFWQFKIVFVSGIVIMHIFMARQAKPKFGLVQLPSFLKPVPIELLN